MNMQSYHEITYLISAAIANQKVYPSFDKLPKKVKAIYDVLSTIGLNYYDNSIGDGYVINMPNEVLKDLCDCSPATCSRAIEILCKNGYIDAMWFKHNELNVRVRFIKLLERS